MSLTCCACNCITDIDNGCSSTASALPLPSPRGWLISPNLSGDMAHAALSLPCPWACPLDHPKSSLCLILRHQGSPGHCSDMLAYVLTSTPSNQMAGLVPVVVAARFGALHPCLRSMRPFSSIHQGKLLLTSNPATIAVNDHD